MDILTKFRLDGKVAIVTGSGRGIGKSIAMFLAQAGADIVIAELDKGTGESTAQSIRALGRKCLPFAADVTDSKQINALVETTISQFGKIDILVNNAGGNEKLAPVVGTSEETWNRTLKLNLTSAFLCSKAVSRSMLKQKSGNIINISSAGGVRAEPGLAAYAAAKAGVISFTQSLSIEFAKYHIRVNCIIPGAIETELGSATRGTAEERVKKAGIPLGRIGRPEDIAFAAVYLASDASDYLTGTSIEVRGGPITRKGDVEMFTEKFPDLNLFFD